MSSLVATLALFGFWLALTGSFSPYDVVVGAVLCVAVGVWTSRSIWPPGAFALTPRQTGRFVLYLGHLLKDVFVAAVQVAEVVLDPRMPIEPVLITHRTSFSRDVSRVAFANSITLTPGTITIDVEGDSFVIHCLSERFADEIISGDLERRVSRVFEE